jgi:phosphoglycolate phosphatase-like HAD superfamily hydrolase
MESVFGTAGPIEGHDFSGKTDPQIARELLHLAGVSDAEIDAGFHQLWEAYLQELEARLVDRPMTVLPGVPALLQHLEGMPDVALGLLTGNIIEGARLKLDSVGLTDYFEVGGYGSDSERRVDLPAVAIRRAYEAWGSSFPPSSVVVIGDTPRDVACGRYGGTKTVAVATGRHDTEVLAAEGPDEVLADLSDLEGSVRALLA